MLRTSVGDDISSGDLNGLGDNGTDGASRHTMVLGRDSCGDIRASGDGMTQSADTSGAKLRQGIACKGQLDIRFPVREDTLESRGPSRRVGPKLVVSRIGGLRCTIVL